MSSRELIDELLGLFIIHDDDGASVLVEASFLPDRSALNTALRGGDWSPQEYREARIAQELASSRYDGRDGTPDLTGLLSPGQVAVENAHVDWQKRRHDENLAQLRGEG